MRRGLRRECCSRRLAKPIWNWGKGGRGFPISPGGKDGKRVICSDTRSVLLDSGVALAARRTDLGRGSTARRTELPPIQSERTGAQHAEEDDPLHRSDQSLGKRGTLQREPGIDERAEEQRPKHGANRVKGTEGGPDDTGIPPLSLLQTCWIQKVTEVTHLAGAG